MDAEKVDKVIRAAEQMQFLRMSERLPKEFYTLTQAEQSEVVKRLRERRNMQRGKPFGETK